jgi:hypothetical protein
MYILSKLMRWKWLDGNPYAALRKINYDINTASRAEIVMTWVSVFIFLCSVVGAVGSAFTY